MFLWNRGWKGIDLGRGPGKGKAKPFKSSEHHPLMGIVIQGVIEKMYNEELWRDPKNLVPKLREILDKDFFFAVQDAYIDWGRSDCPPKTEMYSLCWNGIMGYLRTMKEHRLLGPYARAEVEMPGKVDALTLVNGKADVVIRRDDTGVTILDGKNSKTKGKYTDPDQLRWYALCFWLGYGKLPDRLGFIYYRYPFGAPVEDADGCGTGELYSGVDWVQFTMDDVMGLAQRAADARKGMEAHQFDPRPEPKICKLCDFETVCEARKATKRTRNRKTTLEMLEDANGLVEF